MTVGPELSQRSSTDGTAPFPRRFRLRLTLTFIALAGTAGGALALVSFLLAREQRLDSFESRSRRVAQLNLRLASAARPSFLDDLLASYRQQEGFDVVAAAPGRVLVSAGGSDDVVLRSVAVDGDRYVVVGGAVPRSSLDLYFFFSLEEVLDSLSEFRTALLAGWVFVAVGAALVGDLVARRTLRPVRHASDAARSLAEGLLDTRLPVRTSDEFGAWAAYFNQMADALADKIAALSEARDRERRFIADVAHELRTPLGALVTTSSVLEADLDDLPPDKRRPVELVVEGIRRLRRLAEDLLELSELDAGDQSVHMEELDVAEAVRAVVRMGGWVDTVGVDARPVPVVADRHRLERVLSNLVSNAVTHGGRGVTVSVSAEDGDAVVEVADAGPGIAAGELPNLFRRFYKVRSAPAGSGSGLGLAIAAENARLLGGTLAVDSEEGQGARFTLRLPADRGREPGSTEAVAQP